MLSNLLNGIAMKRSEINESNELIAKFMGYQILHRKYQYQNFNSSNESYFQDDEGEIVCDEHGREVNLYPDGDPLFSLSELPFHKDWNLLMPVVEKIHTMEEYTEEYISEQVIYAPILQAIPLYGIRGVWNEVVEFIKWYNEEEKREVH